ncbi:unnamed protein product [Closterium sp. Naga37s-1]|nr:unnamed protein product [Closterium sp. Naga37s-1]
MCPRSAPCSDEQEKLWVWKFNDNDMFLDMDELVVVGLKSRGAAGAGGSHHNATPWQPFALPRLHTCPAPLFHHIIFKVVVSLQKSRPLPVEQEEGAISMHQCHANLIRFKVVSVKYPSLPVEQEKGATAMAGEGSHCNAWATLSCPSLPYLHSLPHPVLPPPTPTLPQPRSDLVKVVVSVKYPALPVEQDKGATATPSLPHFHTCPLSPLSFLLPFLIPDPIRFKVVSVKYPPLPVEQDKGELLHCHVNPFTLSHFHTCPTPLFHQIRFNVVSVKYPPLPVEQEGELLQCLGNSLLPSTSTLALSAPSRSP